MKYNKQYYFDMGKGCATWYKNNNWSVPEWSYPSCYNGLNISFNGSWQVMAFKAGFDSGFNEKIK